MPKIQTFLRKPTKPIHQTPQVHQAPKNRPNQSKTQKKTKDKTDIYKKTTREPVSKRFSR